MEGRLDRINPDPAGKKCLPTSGHGKATAVLTAPVMEDREPVRGTHWKIFEQISVSGSCVCQAKLTNITADGTTNKPGLIKKQQRNALHFCTER